MDEPQWSEISDNTWDRDALEAAVLRYIDGRDDLNRSQLAGIAAYLFLANADPDVMPSSSDSKREQARLAAITDASPKSIERGASIGKRNPALLGEVIAGQVTMDEASRRVGLREYDRKTPLVGSYSRGDKFWEATRPIEIYLKFWARKEFAFTNVAPREAKRRLTRLKLIRELLDRAIADLELRAERRLLRHHD